MAKRGRSNLKPLHFPGASWTIGYDGEIPLKRHADFARIADAGGCPSAGGLVGCKSQVSGDVMANVDGRKIFRSDVDKYYDNQVANAQQAPTGALATRLRPTFCAN